MGTDIVDIHNNQHRDNSPGSRNWQPAEEARNNWDSTQDNMLHAADMFLAAVAAHMPTVVYMLAAVAVVLAVHMQSARKVVDILATAGGVHPMEEKAVDTLVGMLAGDVNPTWEAAPACQRHARDSSAPRMVRFQRRPDFAPLRNLYHRYRVAVADNYCVWGLCRRPVPVAHQGEIVFSLIVLIVAVAYQGHEMDSCI